MTGPVPIPQKCVRNPVFGTKRRAADMDSRLMTPKTGLMTPKTGLMTPKAGLMTPNDTEIFSESNALGGG